MSEFERQKRGHATDVCPAMADSEVSEQKSVCEPGCSVSRLTWEQEGLGCCCGLVQ